MVNNVRASYLDVVEVEFYQRGTVVLQLPETLVDVRVVRLFHLEGLAGLAFGDGCTKE